MIDYDAPRVCTSYIVVCYGLCNTTSCQPNIFFVSASQTTYENVLFKTVFKDLLKKCQKKKQKNLDYSVSC